MCRAPPRHLRLDVCHHDVRRDNPKPSAINRDYRTVAAEMPAAPARLRVAGDVAGVTALQRSVAIERRQAVTPWLDQVQARQFGSPSTTPLVRRDPGVSPGRSVRSATASRRIAVRDAYEIRLELASQDVADPERPEIGRVERRIQPVGTERRIRINPPDALDHRHRQPGRGVHRQVERHQARTGHHVGVERLAREVDAGNVVPGPAEPRGGRGQAERLTPQFVRRDQRDAHDATGGADSSTSALVGGGVNRLTTINVAIERASAG